MTLLAVERIKLFSTRSPWWCIAITFVLAVGVSLLFSLITRSTGDEMNVGMTQFGYNLALTLVLIFAILAATTEYRFGTIRATFLAAPSRTKVVLAKAGLLAIVCGVLGEVTAFSAWGVGWLVQPDADLALNSGADWRYVTGVGIIYALSAIMAVGIGLLVRQTAGAIAIVLVYSIVVESILVSIPKVNDAVAPFLPFINANQFLTAGAGEAAGEATGLGLELHWGAWPALAYFAVFPLVFLVLAIIVVNRRDA